ncbi:glycosyl hydrolase 115 family protein [Roseibacillus persicicus]|uniref:glycosyl hydrolase 115 family protein n=1 Tax=Roseibacillus persicicus TaxID=454148 RepID=UPI00280DB82A|nr:glycosyl hydrolase 115 family protein [Roseibacillus persicicus]MDQ8192595.1 glycosyl hydrolase 115 family protein [Roseibacillus persicicus]
MTASDTSNGGTTSFNGDLNRWSDGLAPQSGNTYFNNAYLLRTPSSGSAHTFAGDSLTIGRSANSIGRLLLKGIDDSTLTVGNLILDGGLIDMGVGNGTITNNLAGAITVLPEFKGYLTAEGSSQSGTGGETLDIHASISGSGEIQIGGTWGAASLEGLDVPTAAISNAAGTIRLSAANSFDGHVTVAGRPVNSTRGGLQLAHPEALRFATLNLTTTNSSSVPPVSFAASLNTEPFQIAALEGDATLVLGDTTDSEIVLEVGGTGASSTFNGVLEGPGVLKKVGAGTLRLSGEADHGCRILVAAGVVELSEPSLGNESEVSVTNGASLHLAHGETDTIATLYFDEVEQVDGVYNAANSGGRITGSGSINVGDEPELVSNYRSTRKWVPYDGTAVTPSSDPDYYAIPFMPVTENATSESLKIAGGGQTATIHYSLEDAAVVQIAAEALGDDIERVTGLTPEVSTATPSDREVILVGTLGSSPLIDSLHSSGKIDPSEIEGKWEAYLATVVENPLPGVARALVIAGSDRRGTAFGVFALSESMGVSPWYWWANVPTPSRSAIHIAGSHIQHSPGVKYRGIFLNDEDWGLQPWAANTFEPEVGNIGPKTYATIFELLLRLHSNLIWPAMHHFPVETTPFYEVPGNKEMADDYAIVISTSHHEPMLRNSYEYDEGDLGPYNYWTNRENIAQFWEQRVAETADYENIYTMGMRGRDDAGMLAPSGTSNREKARKIQNEIIPDQRQMITDHVNADASEIPQIFIPYKETLVQYQAGLELPDDVTMLWPDDNHGYIRQLSTDAERARSGGSGVYYHLSYWGVPTSYLWLCSTPPGMTCSEMIKAWDFEADKIWLVNVGDLKPHELGTDFFLRMARNPEGFRNFDQRVFFEQWAARTFSPAQAEGIADVLEEYFRLNITKRPEHLNRSNSGFSLVDNGDEGQKRLDDFAAMTEQANAIYQQLPAEQKSAFYEMVLYPVRGSNLVNRRVILAERSRLWEEQGRASTNAVAAEAEAAHDALLAENQFYNEVNADGKWNLMIDPMPISQLPGWARETQNAFIMPEVGSFNAAGGSSLGVVVEGSREPLEAGMPGELPMFNRPSDSSYFIDVFNQKSGTMNWTATTSVPWINLSRSQGSEDARIWVRIDWKKAPRGHAVPGQITISGLGGQYEVSVRAFYPLDLNLTELPEHVENNSLVEIEAEDFAERDDSSDGVGWRLVDQATASEDGMTIQPVTVDSLNPNNLPDDTPSLTYRFYTFGSGPVKISTQCLPTHRITSDHPGLRYAISLNGDEPQIIDVNAVEYSSAWNANTLRAASIGVSKHNIAEPGMQAVRIWMVDAGVVLDKLTMEIASGTFEAEDLEVHNSNRSVVEFSDGPASEGGGLHIQSTSVNDFAILRLPEMQAGDYELTVNVKRWTSRGIIQMAIAENPSGPYQNIGGEFDLYDRNGVYVELESVPVSFNFDGTKYLRFTVVGKNSAATNYWILLDYLKFERVNSVSGLPLRNWRSVYFGNPNDEADASDYADPDFDGIPNLLEYATGSYPTLASASPVSSEWVGDFFTLKFDRAKVATDVVYRVMAGNTLPPETEIWSSESNPYAGGELLTFEETVFDVQSVAASPTRFLQLQVVRPD